MKKETLITQLEGAMKLSSQVDIIKVIALLDQLEPEVQVEKVFGITQELADRIEDRIQRTLEYNSNDLADTSSAEFELNYDNRIELSRVDINVYDIMGHVNAVLEEFIVAEEEDDAEEDMTFAREEDDRLNDVEAELMGFEGLEDDGPFPFSPPDQWGTTAGGTMDNEMS
jgi:hypothetical protein